MAAERKTSRQVITISSLIGAMMYAFLFAGCADVHYASNPIHSPEAPYNTYYAPDYYPYYPWDAYYGGAYYYGE